MEDLECPLCHEAIAYICKTDFWECQNCGTEIWPGTKETKRLWNGSAIEKGRTWSKS